MHLRYVQRDGVTRQGLPGDLYSADQDRADGKAFIDRADGDRHQFRFIVSAEDGCEYDDLKPLTRRLMAQVEQDRGTKLDWVAATGGCYATWMATAMSPRAIAIRSTSRCGRAACRS